MAATRAELVEGERQGSSQINITKSNPLFLTITMLKAVLSRVRVRV